MSIDISVCAKVPLGEWKAGSPTHLHEFITGLSRHARVKAYVPYVTGNYSPEGLEIYETGSRYKNPVFNMFHFSTVAQMNILNGAQDIIHWRLDLAQELLLLPATRGKKICEVNGPLLEEQAQMRSMPGPVYWAARNELIRNLKKFDRIVVVSDELKELLTTAYGMPADRISVVYNGVNPELFSPGKFSKEANGIRQRLGVADKKVLGFVGGLRPWHGVQNAIRMMARLKNIRSDTMLCVIGSGHEFEKICSGVREMGLEDCVRMIGAVPYAEVPKYVEMFDIALAPYPMKGVSNYFNPLKLFEYMAMEKPVICGCTSWAGRFLSNDRGVIIDCEDPVTFASTVCTLLDDPDKSRSIARNARNSAVKDFTWESNIERMMQVYSSLQN